MSTQRRGPQRRRPKDRSDKADAVLAALRASAPATVSALAAATGYSRPTVTEILSELAACGVATESALEEQGVGRPAGAWDLRADAGLVMGLDILPTSALLSAADLGCRVRAARLVPLPAAPATERLDAVVTAVRALAHELDAHGPLRALAATSTGRVGADGTVLQADLSPAWTAFPLAERLSEELGVSVVVDNDINAAALGEFHARRQQGRIRPDGDLLFVQLARGLHTGLILGGAIHRGHEFNAGEIADFLDLRLDEHTLVTDEWIRRVAVTVASVGAVVDPDAIVISSPSASSRRTVTRVLQALSALRTPSSPSFRGEVSELGWAAGAVGALHRAFAAADQSLTGTGQPRPVTLTGTGLHQSRVGGGGVGQGAAQHLDALAVGGQERAGHLVAAARGQLEDHRQVVGQLVGGHLVAGRRQRLLEGQQRCAPVPGVAHRVVRQVQAAAPTPVEDLHIVLGHGPLAAAPGLSDELLQEDGHLRR